MRSSSLFICVLIAAMFTVSAQVHKKFINKNGKVTKDSIKAIAYILYQQTDQDSIWSMVKLDMHNRPIEKGTYLDEDMTVPYGKFVYYQMVLNQKKIDESHSSIDTVIRVRQTGFYINGKKEGVWLEFYSNGVKRASKIYESNEPNGLYEEFDPGGRIYIRGNYINGGKEGDWYTFWRDSTLMDHRTYSNGISMFYEQFDQRSQVHNARPGFNFTYFIQKYLKKIGVPPSHGSVIVSFTITVDGKLIRPEVTMGVNPNLDKAIIEAITNSPTWVSATKDKKRIEQRLSWAFKYDIDK